MSTSRLLSPITTADGLQLANRVVMAPMTRARAGKSRVPNRPWRRTTSSGPPPASSSRRQRWSPSRASAGSNFPRHLHRCPDGGLEPGRRRGPRQGRTDLPAALALRAGIAPRLLRRRACRWPLPPSARRRPAATPPGKAGLRDAARAGDGGDPASSPTTAAPRRAQGGRLRRRRGPLGQRLPARPVPAVEDQPPGGPYGGSVENRYRLLREVVEAVKPPLPAERVGVRCRRTASSTTWASPDYRELHLRGPATGRRSASAFLHVMDGLAFGFHELGEPMTLAEFRALFHGPLMGNCGYTQQTARGARSPTGRRT